MSHNYAARPGYWRSRNRGGGKTLIDLVARGNDADRSSVLSLQNLQLGNASGQPIALLLSGTALGFLAIFGVLALIGILIRNSIILVHEIEKLLHQGRSRLQAVLEGTDSRARPIL